ncbi:MAG TPA: HU family DNA-binding protein [bacterium]|nr:HU family DNA-binding protein [bacterium]
MKRQIKTIIRKDVCNKIASELNLDPKIVDEIILNFFDSFEKCIIAEDKVELRNFGVFQMQTRQPKIGRNLKTNEPINLPKRRYLSFKPGKEMRNKVNGR